MKNKPSSAGDPFKVDPVSFFKGPWLLGVGSGAKNFCSSRMVLKITMRQVAIPARHSGGAKGISAAKIQEAAPAIKIVIMNRSLRAKDGEIYSLIGGSEKTPAVKPGGGTVRQNSVWLPLRIPQTALSVCRPTPKFC